MRQKIFEISENSLTVLNEWFLDQKALLDFGDEIDLELFATLNDIITKKHITEEAMNILCMYLYNLINEESTDTITARTKLEALKITEDLQLTDIFKNN